MGDTLRGGAKGALADSLALYIQEAFDTVRAEYGLGPLPEEGAEDREMLFIGIARGMVTYLRDFTEAFVIESHRTATATDASRHSTTHEGHVKIRVSS